MPCEPVLKKPHLCRAGTEQVAKAALSNMLGGVGYFHGASDVRLRDGRAVRSWPAALFSAVPSRPFFPRGFIWDEGFHQVTWRPRFPSASRSPLKNVALG